MARARIGAYTGFVVLVLLLVFAVQGYGDNTTEWVVGGDNGWTFGVAGWENGKPIHSGDILDELFKYKAGEHNVVEVNVDGYMQCKAPDGAQIYSSGNDRIEMPGGKAYFICSFSGHCERGMRIGIPPR